jgi:hypothetical protein
VHHVTSWLYKVKGCAERREMQAAQFKVRGSDVRLF